MSDGMFQARAFSGRYFIGQGRAFSTNEATPQADHLLAVPFNAMLTADSFALNVTSAGAAGAAARFGIYASGSDGLPTDLLVGSDEIALDEAGVALALLGDPFVVEAPIWLVAVFSAAETMPTVTLNSLVAEELHRIYGAPNFNIAPFVNTFNGVTAEFTYDELPETFPTPHLGPVPIALSLRSA
jgi:hypothetical protein